MTLTLIDILVNQVNEKQMIEKEYASGRDIILSNPSMFFTIIDHLDSMSMTIGEAIPHIEDALYKAYTGHTQLYVEPEERIDLLSE